MLQQVIGNPTCHLRNRSRQTRLRTNHTNHEKRRHRQQDHPVRYGHCCDGVFRCVLPAWAACALVLLVPAYSLSTVSVTGNAAHVVLHAAALPVVAAAGTVVPPIALLAAVHGVTILLRAHARARLTQVLATLMTVLIAAGAFRLSFTALRDLAVLAAGPGEGGGGVAVAAHHLIIEGSMAQADGGVARARSFAPHHVRTSYPLRTVGIAGRSTPTR